MDLHQAFGGELWFDGQLCFKDGEVIVEPFVLDKWGEWEVDDFIKERGKGRYWKGGTQQRDEGALVMEERAILRAMGVWSYYSDESDESWSDAGDA
ncbi:MAG: hypothetical protein MMC23_003593 [Stictis urceolatum]|nr:hypothetical protein [Stictis urceolata]